jgi:hypothetical protein
VVYLINKRAGQSYSVVAVILSAIVSVVVVILLQSCSEEDKRKYRINAPVSSKRLSIHNNCGGIHSFDLQHMMPDVFSDLKCKRVFHILTLFSPCNMSKDKMAVFRLRYVSSTWRVAMFKDDT